jgi:hypothetical protein
LGTLAFLTKWKLFLHQNTIWVFFMVIIESPFFNYNATKNGDALLCKLGNAHIALQFRNVHNLKSCIFFSRSPVRNKNKKAALLHMSDRWIDRQTELVVNFCNSVCLYS